MKVNAIDATIPSNTGLVTKILDDSVKKGLEKEIMDVNKKIPNTSGLVKKTDYNKKITEIENKIQSCFEQNETEVESKNPHTESTYIQNKIPNNTSLILLSSID